LKGVGEQIASKLEKLHIKTLQDVLFHLPIRYEDRSTLVPIKQLQVGQSALICGEIIDVRIAYGRRRSLVVSIADDARTLSMRLFYFNQAQQRNLRIGEWITCYGQVRFGQKGLEMIHPDYKVSAQQPDPTQNAGLTPVYPSTEGLGQAFWRKISDQVLEQHLGSVEELLPESLTVQYEFGALQKALAFIHRPDREVDTQVLVQGESKAHQRLIFEELLAHILSMRKKREVVSFNPAPTFVQAQSDLEQQLLAGLAFQLTNAQVRVANDIHTDLAKPQPMQRLVQGDVGSGKTVVAALAMLRVIAANFGLGKTIGGFEGGFQCALMAPTELLAEQHFRTLTAWFEPLQIAVGWLSSKTPTAQKKATLQALADGSLHCVVGTHALIQEGVSFNNLALIVIDEQHRFGVEQRLALRDKAPGNVGVHQLSMTATPIPRTLAMSFYADLDVSNIDELPPGRKEISTVVAASEQKREEVIERVLHACQTGKQVYWVCPLIEESEALEAQAATDVHEELSARFAGFDCALIHGRMKTAEKESVMQAFRNAEVSVLIATTVIEVGVDVPNASLMVIENAERMGLAQLHQLRGRVGRGDQQSFCVLLYQQPISQLARERLNVMRETNDGFLIAEKDLELRGAGEVLGTRQTGAVSFKIADISRDQQLLPQVNRFAEQILTQHDELVEPLVQRWVGDREQFINV
jgi:ATP-dependent DNA helicase RecG